MDVRQEHNRGASKLLPFPASTALRGFDGSLTQEAGRVAGPAGVEMTTRPSMGEQQGLAHDARNLVTALELFSSLLDEPGVLAEEHKHFATDLKSLTNPLASLVERMANAAQPVRTQRAEPGARTGSGKDAVFVREPLRPALTPSKAVWLEQEREQKDAGMMVKSCERLLAAIAGPAIALNVSHERGLGELPLDGESLTRVLMNLVKNASEAMPGGGRIAITVRKGLGAEPSALLSVQDTGAGIPAHALGQIFQAGFSSKKAQQKWPASRHHGLGLTIVRELVEDAGGSIRVLSALRKGTTFEIKLPCQRLAAV